MENTGLLIIDINEGKKKDIIKYDSIINKESIEEFNSSLKSLFRKDINEIRNKNIFINFVKKYLYSRNINYLLKRRDKLISENKIPKKFISYLYSYVLYYIFVHYKYIKLMDNKKLYAPSKFFDLVTKLFKSNLLSIKYVINAFKFYLYQLIQYKKNLIMSQQGNELKIFLKYFYKILKDKNSKNADKEINDLIQKENLAKLFEILNGTPNNKNDDVNLYLINSFRKEENIFLLLKLLVENKFLSEENKAYLEVNLIKFLKNNFRKEHLNYFYEITKKILIKFNYLNQKAIKPKNYNKTDKNNFLSLNKDFKYLTKITDLLIKVVEEEKKQNKDESCYYCDKGFVFNIETLEIIGLQVKDVEYNQGKKNTSFCILFTFLLKENKKIGKNTQLIFSINDSDNKAYLSLIVRDKKLYIKYLSKKTNEIQLIDITYNNYYSFFFLYDKSKFKVYVNNSNVLTQNEKELKFPNKLNVFIGSPEKKQNENNPEYTFSGIICPVILFEMNNMKIDEIKKCLLNIKNIYYILGDIYFNEKECQDKDKNGNYNYEEYYGLYDELSKEKNAKTLIKNITNVILYINPYVVHGSFNRKMKIYKDYNNYETKEKNNGIAQYSYEFNIVPSLEQGMIFSFIDNNIISFFKLNNGINLIILEIELIYNYILLLNENKNYISLVKENAKEFYELINELILKNLEFFKFFIIIPKNLSIKNRRKYICSFFFSIFKLIQKLNDIFEDYNLNGKILDHLIEIVKIFNNNEMDIYLRNKLINSLVDKKLYNNNIKLINKLNSELLNCFQNFENKFNTSEIFLNIFQIYKHDKNEKMNDDLLILMINSMPNNEFNKLLISINSSQYLDNISNAETVFGYILKSNIHRYSNDKLIKKQLFEIFDKITKINKYNELVSNKEELKEKYNNFLIILLSILLYINENYDLNTNDEDINLIEKLIFFLNKLKDNKLNLKVFKCLFLELYEYSNNIENKLKYINNEEINTEKYSVKKLTLDLFNYLCNLIDSVLLIEPNKSIIIELLIYFEKIYKDYIMNENDKQSNYVKCHFTHILNSDKILQKFFTYLFTYAKIYNKDQKDKIYVKNIFDKFQLLIIFLFNNCLNPSFFTNFKKYLNDETNFIEYYEFLDEFIDIIYKEREDRNNEDKRKIFYENSIQLLKIIYLSTKNNITLLSNKNFENLFEKYYLFLKENKMFLAPYEIVIENKNNNEIYRKTIFETCIEIIISLETDNNLFEKIFNEEKFKDHIFKIKEMDFKNEEFNKYLKSLKYKKNEKEISILMINKLCECIINNRQNNSDKKKDIYNKYLEKFTKGILENYEKWSKLEKEYEELKLLKNIKNDNFEELISLVEKKIEKEKNKRRDSIKSENKSQFNNYLNEENQNKCPLKKNCLLIKNKSSSNKLDIFNNINDINKPTEKYGNYIDIELKNIILCLKRDLLLTESSIYFSDIYFKDKNFSNVKKYFKYTYENNKKIILENKIEKFNYPIKVRNYSNNKYAYPHIFLKPYISFYNCDSFDISHPYFKRESIKKPSFPYLFPHYYLYKDILENNNVQIYFNKECEAIIKTDIMCGNIILKDQYLYFINNNEIKKNYGKKIEYLFCSLVDDIKLKNKIIMIKYQDIEEIINRRYIYDYRAIEIFLKNGKSYYFNLFVKENVNSFFEEIEKIQNKNNKNSPIIYDFLLIKDPIKYFEDNKYFFKWKKNEISTYQYLLYINKFSSRSYNDINQYPIFPWIFLESGLGSHKNENNLPKFRELAFPISIKKDEDKEEAKLFFESNLIENPKYPSHYRLHYSTSGYLLSYLVRVSPFTEEQIRFQNNQFDSPNRQLQSIDEILHILTSSSDNRELIPEFFTTPEFLLNCNYVDFGYRLNDKIMINDVKWQEKFFNSITQFIYYNRLILNKKSHYKEVNAKDFQEELKINSWIDLIFGYKQWDKNPKKDKLNLFGKYCYKQNVNFDNILGKYKKKGIDEKQIIRKIESKKSRLINFGQCPEMLFRKKHEESILSIDQGNEDKAKKELNHDDLNDMEYDIANISAFNHKIKIDKKYSILTFWLSENGKFIYFLGEEKKKGNNSEVTYSILIYNDCNEDQIKYVYKIELKEINLFKVKQTCKEITYSIDNNSNIELSKTKTGNSPQKIFEFFQENLNTNKRKLSNKEKGYNAIGKQPAKQIDYFHYKLFPKYCLFDICLENKIYFFTGRRLDNSIRIYEINEDDKTREIKENKFNIRTDSFVSCLYKKDSNIFFSGHKNGKLYEWKIIYNYDKNKKRSSSINNVEILRDLMAHKESMICCINYVKKLNIILTSSNDGKLIIRNYYNFELLSMIETKQKGSVISKIIYSDYDLLYLLINHKDKESKNKYSINVYTLNGLLIESSSMKNIVDLELLKNGKIICNFINYDQLLIFGLNTKLGSFNTYEILSKIKNFREKDEEKEERMINFIFKSEQNCFYVLSDYNNLYRQEIPEFEEISIGVDKLKLYRDSKDANIENKKIEKPKRYEST